MRVLVVDNEEEFAGAVTRKLEALGHAVKALPSGRQAFYRLTADRFDVVLTNLLLPDWDGFKLIEALSVAMPRLPVVVWTGAEHEYIDQQLEKYGNVAAVLNKLEDEDRLDEVLGRLPSDRSTTALKLARIVCTLGPACSDRKTIGDMILAGMDVARFNFSHGDHQGKTRLLQELREAAEHWGRNIGVLQDLCGPKIRTSPMQDGAVDLEAGRRLTIAAGVDEGTAERIGISDPAILPDLRERDSILLDDGNLEFVVVQEGEKEVVCEVVVGGPLGSRKGVNLPSTRLRQPSLTEKDRADLEWGVEHGVDYVALSFVRSPGDIVELKEILREKGSQARVVAKIEKPEAVALLDQILEEADAVMIARGDLGVEIRAERVPLIQRDIIRRASQMQKPVITATQMLDSMTQKMRPTRAEVTDVSHAVLEGSDAVMLSGETAVGIDPVNAVRTMSAIVRQAETEAVRSTPASADAPQQALQTGCDSVKNIHQALQCGALSADVAAIVVIGNEWGRVQDLPKVARSTPVILATDSPVLARQSALWHGVLPILIERCGAYTEVGCEVLRLARRHGYLNPGQLVAVIEYVNSPATELVEEGALHITRIDGS